MNGEGRLVLQHILGGCFRFRRAAGPQQRSRQNSVNETMRRIGMNRAPSRIQCFGVSLTIKVHGCQREVRARIMRVH